MRGFVYVISNNINNKVYIGLTTTSIEIRWKEHIRSCRKSYLNYKIYNAMNKYGIENFKIEELEAIENISLLELDELESYYISLADSIENGYNISKGGLVPNVLRPILNELDIIYLYSINQMPLEKIAEAYNTSRYIITTILSNNSVTIRDRHNSACKANKITKEQLLEAFAKYKTERQVAKHLNVCLEVIKRARLIHGIEYNSSKSGQHLYNKDDDIC